MVIEPGHLRVLMKSERAINNSLGIGICTPLGETATYFPVASIRAGPGKESTSTAAQSLSEWLLPDAARAASEKWIFGSVMVNVVILFLVQATNKRRKAQRKTFFSEPNFASLSEDPKTEIGAQFFMNQLLKYTFRRRMGSANTPMGYL